MPVFETASKSYDREASRRHAIVTNCFDGRGPRPFGGPAGKLPDRALQEAVEFRDQCLPSWLEAEISVIRPKLIICQGATAAQSILGTSFRLTKERGRFAEHPWAPFVTATIHPATILRTPGENRRQEYRRFVQDSKRAAKVAAAS